MNRILTEKKTSKTVTKKYGSWPPGSSGLRSSVRGKSVDSIDSIDSASSSTSRSSVGSHSRHSHSGSLASRRDRGTFSQLRTSSLGYRGSRSHTSRTKQSAFRSRHMSNSSEDTASAVGNVGARIADDLFSVKLNLEYVVHSLRTLDDVRCRLQYDLDAIKGQVEAIEAKLAVPSASSHEHDVRSRGSSHEQSEESVRGRSRSRRECQHASWETEAEEWKDSVPAPPSEEILLHSPPAMVKDEATPSPATSVHTVRPTQRPPSPSPRTMLLLPLPFYKLKISQARRFYNFGGGTLTMWYHAEQPDEQENGLFTFTLLPVLPTAWPQQVLSKIPATSQSTCLKQVPLRIYDVNTYLHGAEEAVGDAWRCILFLAELQVDENEGGVHLAGLSLSDPATTGETTDRNVSQNNSWSVDAEEDPRVDSSLVLAVERDASLDTFIKSARAKGGLRYLKQAQLENVRVTEDLMEFRHPRSAASPGLSLLCESASFANPSLSERMAALKPLEYELRRRGLFNREQKTKPTAEEERARDHFLDEVCSAVRTWDTSEPRDTDW